MHSDYYTRPDQWYSVLYLDEDPEVAAVMHSDRHLGKALLSAAQILSMVWFVSSLPHREDVDTVLTLDWTCTKDEPPYGQLAHSDARLFGQRIYFTGHNDHPCIHWASLYGGNYDWLYRLGCALLDEYKFRFGRTHSTTPVLRVLEMKPPGLLATADTWCDAPVVLPPEFVVQENAVESYRKYCKKQNVTFMQYTCREKPEWL